MEELRCRIPKNVLDEIGRRQEFVRGMRAEEMKMNDCNRNFLSRNRIDREILNREVDTHIYTAAEKNEIVAKYGLETDRTDKKISIANIVGMHTRGGIPANIFEAMNSLWNDRGSGYESRSTEMLNYNKDNVIKKFEESFSYEPIEVIETGEGEYTVRSNGLHRSILLRIFYLSEVAEVQGDEKEMKRLKQKYTIPVKVCKVDLLKTYCRYLLLQARHIDSSQNVLAVSLDYNDTGYVSITYLNGEEQRLDDSALVEKTRQEIIRSSNFQSILQLLQDYCEKYGSFRTFIDENLGDIISQKEEATKARS